MNEKESLGSQIKTWILNNILGLCSLVPPVAAFLYKWFAPKEGGWTHLEILLLLVVCVESAVIFIKALWDKYSYRSYKYPWSKIRTHYEFIEKRISYKLNSMGELEYKRSLRIEPKINNLESIRDKFIWTGSSDAELPRPVSGLKSIDSESILGIWTDYRMNFEFPLDKGEPYDIIYQWHPIPDCKSSSPYCSTSTEVPTKRVIFDLDLGKEYRNHRIFLEEYRALEADYMISRQAVKLDDYGKYSWNVSKVKRFRHYRIRWSWENAEAEGTPTGKERGNE